LAALTTVLRGGAVAAKNADDAVPQLKLDPPSGANHSYRVFCIKENTGLYCSLIRRAWVMAAARPKALTSRR
jgi:hypothetical protein